MFVYHSSLGTVMRYFTKHILAYFGILMLSLCFVFPALSSDRVTVFAAASLKDALDEIISEFNANSPQNNIIVSYASSGVLARQIAQGASADLFISANQDWVNFLVDERVIVRSQSAGLISNKLVVAVSKQNPVDKPWQDVVTQAKFAMGDPAHVPAGIYAEQALKRLSLWDMAETNAVFGENVRISLRLVSRGEVGAAILYKSDAKLDQTIKIVHEFGPKDHDQIIYPSVLLNDINPVVRQFYQYLTDDKTKEVFSLYGFTQILGSSDVDKDALRSERPDDDISLVDIILLSLKVAFFAMLFAVPIAYGIAFILARFTFRGKSLLQAVVMLPLVLPPVVTGYVLLEFFGSQGVVGQFFSMFGIEFAFSWIGAALAAALMAFPLLVRPMRLSIEAIDRGFDDAANTLGANAWVRFTTIILPLSLPGIIAGSVLGFAKALGEFGATITFVSNIPNETQTISLAIYSFLQSPKGDGAALNLILVSTLIAVSAVLLSEYLAARITTKAES